MAGKVRDLMTPDPLTVGQEVTLTMPRGRCATRTSESSS